VALGASTFTMSALPSTPELQNAIPMPFFGTTPFAAWVSASWPRSSSSASASGGCVASRRSGGLDGLPHNGAVFTLLAVCGATHRESYRDVTMAGIIGPLLALALVIALGSSLGSF
jgi:H+/gluconate symporter-like permease